ncbi:MAG: hypothetical protein QHH74_14990 [Spirochaetota bacterium]|nr:hypothetical protein [Spirochaetota bacterium]
MAMYKNICVVMLMVVVLLFYWDNVFAQSVGYNKIFLGSAYNRVKDILQHHDYNFKEMKCGVIRVILYDDSQSQGMLIFDYFDRLYTIIVTIPVTDAQFDQLQQHLQKKYGEFTVNDTVVCCTFGIYRIALHHNKTSQTATVEYGHTIPLFYPKKPVEENPFSQF